MNEVRVIVPGRYDKLKTATLRPVVVERLNGEGPLTLGNAAIKTAEKTFKGFHAVYSSLYVMIAMPDAEPDPVFEQFWEALTFTPKQKTINIVVVTDIYGTFGEIQVEDLPTGWSYQTEHHEDEKAAMREEEAQESLRQSHDEERFE
jgi:hypothetical protein